MATFNWTISTLERELSDGGVIVAHWRCNASETVGTGDDAVDYSASSYGTAGFTPDPEAEDFVAYDDLTEADVLAWVWESVDKDATEAALQAKIDAEKNPTTAAGVPW
jgi:hypothetical protein